MLKILFFLFALTCSVNAYFPMGKCYDRSCAFTPFDLVVTSNIGNRMCFTLQEKECKPSPYKCCQKFQEKLIKIVFSSFPECRHSVDYVTLNGNKRGGGIYFDLYNGGKDAELRITNLHLPYNRTLNSVFCIHLKGTCNNFFKFCGSKCQLAYFDPLQHSCCPTCNFPKMYAPPPPPFTSPLPFPPPMLSPPPPKSSPPPPPKSSPPPPMLSPPPPMLSPPPPMLSPPPPKSSPPPPKSSPPPPKSSPPPPMLSPPPPKSSPPPPMLSPPPPKSSPPPPEQCSCQCAEDEIAVYY